MTECQSDAETLREILVRLRKLEREMERIRNRMDDGLVEQVNRIDGAVQTLRWSIPVVFAVLSIVVTLISVFLH